MLVCLKTRNSLLPMFSSTVVGQSSLLNQKISLMRITEMPTQRRNQQEKDSLKNISLSNIMVKHLASKNQSRLLLSLYVHGSHKPLLNTQFYQINILLNCQKSMKLARREKAVDIMTLISKWRLFNFLRLMITQVKWGW